APAGGELDADHPAHLALQTAIATEQRTRQLLDEARSNLETSLDGARPVTDDLLNQLVQQAADDDTQLIADTR
ncbi:hypothetical protein, partial [Mycobacteroides abscessus]|uniref:hypothetical protein n=1 Tax=Mycobacteroides abscessus TaxID=36809 RepID=UPI0013FE4384